jgi:hypothetical protein
MDTKTSSIASASAAHDPEGDARKRVLSEVLNADKERLAQMVLGHANRYYRVNLHLENDNVRLISSWDHTDHRDRISFHPMTLNDKTGTEEKMTTYFAKSKAISACKLEGDGWQITVNKGFPFYKGPSERAGRGKKTNSGFFVRDDLQSKRQVLAFRLAVPGEPCDPDVILPQALTPEELLPFLLPANEEDEDETEETANDNKAAAAMALVNKTVSAAAALPVLPALPIITPSLPYQLPPADPETKRKARDAVSKAKAKAKAAAVASAASVATAAVVALSTAPLPIAPIAPIAPTAPTAPAQAPQSQLCQFSCHQPDKHIVTHTVFRLGSMIGHYQCACEQYSEHIYSGFTKWAHWNALAKKSIDKKGEHESDPLMLFRSFSQFPNLKHYHKIFNTALTLWPYLKPLPEQKKEWRHWSVTCSNCFEVARFKYYQKGEQKFSPAHRCPCQSVVWACCGKVYTDKETADVKKHREEKKDAKAYLYPFPHGTSCIYEEVSEAKIFTRQVLSSVFRHCPVCFTCFSQEDHKSGNKDCRHCGHSVCTSCYKEVLLPNVEWSWAAKGSKADQTAFRVGWSLLCQNNRLAAQLYYKDESNRLIPFDYDNRAKNNHFHECPEKTEDERVRSDWLHFKSIFGSRSIPLRDQFFAAAHGFGWSDFLPLVKRVCV